MRGKIVTQKETGIMPQAYRFVFDETTDLDEVERTFMLSLIAAEGPYGKSRVRMDVSFYLDRPTRQLIIDSKSVVGELVAQIFTAFAMEEYGEDSFSVGSVDSKRHSPSTTDNDAETL